MLQHIPWFETNPQSISYSLLGLARSLIQTCQISQCRDPMNSCCIPKACSACWQSRHTLQVRPVYLPGRHALFGRSKTKPVTGYQTSVLASSLGRKLFTSVYQIAIFDVFSQSIFSFQQSRMPRRALDFLDQITAFSRRIGLSQSEQHHIPQCRIYIYSWNTGTPS